MRAARFGLAFLELGSCAAFAFVGRAAAEDTRSVLWLRQDDAGDAAVRLERERMLRLELQARNMVLLDGVVPEARGDTPQLTTAQAAAEFLERGQASAVLWLEGEAERPVSWLFVRRKDTDTLGKAPLPYPPQAIEAQLFALAAASLLEQVLSEAPPAAPEPQAAVPSPAAVAAKAPIEPAVAPKPSGATELSRPRVPSTPDFFVQVGFALPFAAVHSGMKAASKPTLQQVFMLTPVVNDQGATERRYLFDNSSIYIPDGDSFDDFENRNAGIPRGVTPPLGGCKGDGIKTKAEELPSSFCVRVDHPGFVLVPALRLAVGHWFLPRLALALVYQWHFNIRPQSFFGNQSFALEGQYVLLGQHTAGFSLAALMAVLVGRTETPVVQATGQPTINALAGPLGFSAGLSLRYMFSQALGIVVIPVLDARAPAGQLGFELSLAGEYGF